MNKHIDANLLKLFDEKIEDKKRIKKLQNIISNKSLKEVCINSKLINNINYVYDIDLVGLPVENDELTNRSWIFSTTNIIRQKIVKTFNFDDFSISNSYITFYDKLEKCNLIFDYFISFDDLDLNSNRNINFLLNSNFLEVGQWKLASNILKKYGIVPFNKMKDKYHSSFPEDVNYFLNWKIIEFLNVLKNTKKNEHERILLLKNKILKDIYKILEMFYGTPPELFDFKYENTFKKNSNYLNSFNDVYKKTHTIQKITPQEFLSMFVDENFFDSISVVNYGENEHKKYKSCLFKNVCESECVNHYSVEINFLIFLVLDEIIENNLVWISADTSKSVEKDLGIFHNNIYEYNKFFNIDFNIDKNKEIKSKLSKPKQSMVVTGVDFEIKNWKEMYKQIIETKNLKLIEKIKISKWKIENSKGTSFGYWGYFSMNNDWFKKYVYQAIIPLKKIEKYLSIFYNQSLNDFLEEHIELWDYRSLLI